jgi:acyl-CoA reductase-like NAD-dependent aldehyde dehydrogenase
MDLLLISKELDMSKRIDVKKTYKLFIGGAFPRTESGRTYQVKNSRGVFIANPCMASRKDLKDAVVAARAAQSGWSQATAYNRGQILYRIAEMLEGRRDQFVAEICELTGATTKKASDEVEASIDLLVWYAGWTDKISALDFWSLLQLYDSRSTRSRWLHRAEEICITRIHRRNCPNYCQWKYCRRPC